MKDINKTIIIPGLSVLAGLLIASYFYFESRSPAPDPMAQLDSILKGEPDSQPSANTPAPSAESGPRPGSQAEIPTPGPQTAAVDNKLKALATDDAGHTAREATETYVLPPPRIAPDMFTFQSLPNNAPVAEFPLVLVGQKNIEWQKYVTTEEGGGSFGGSGAGRTLHGATPRPPGSPPPPPSGPPSGPPTVPPPVVPPPVIPPPVVPPPEVSTSGI